MSSNGQRSGEEKRREEDVMKASLRLDYHLMACEL